MSATSATLPADWSEFLQEIDRQVAHAIATVDARIAQTPASNIEQLQEERSHETVRLEECVQGLRSHLDSADNLVRDVDVALLAGEQMLREHADSGARVRQKLAAWAGRAIG